MENDESESDVDEVHSDKSAKGDKAREGEEVDSDTDDKRASDESTSDSSEEEDKTGYKSVEDELGVPLDSSIEMFEKDDSLAVVAEEKGQLVEIEGSSGTIAPLEEDDHVFSLQNVPARKGKLKKVKATSELIKKEPAKVWATQVAPVSMRLHWQPFEKDTGYPVVGYRIAQCDHIEREYSVERRGGREEKKTKIEKTPFNVICENTLSTDCEFVVVNLTPGRGYTFKITAYTKQAAHIPYKMIGGSLISSGILKTKPAKFVYSWFFENRHEIEKEWRIFFDDPKKQMERRKAATAIELRTKDAVQTDRLSQLMMSLTAKESDNCGDIYYVGKSCCELPFTGEYGGGIFIDVVTNDNREYEYKVMVRHSELANDATSLRVWDMDDDWVISSKRCVRKNQWEELRVVMTGSHKFRSRIYIQVNEGYAGKVWIDAMTVTILGKSKLAEAAYQLESVASESYKNRPKKAIFHVEKAINLPLLAPHLPCNSHVEVRWIKPVLALTEGLNSPGSDNSQVSPTSPKSTSPKSPTLSLLSGSPKSLKSPKTPTSPSRKKKKKKKNSKSPTSDDDDERDALLNASDLIDKSEVINKTFEPEWDDFNVTLDLSDCDDESILLVRVVQDDDILCSVKLHGDDLFRAPAHRLYYKMENHLQMPGTDEREQDMILIALRVEYIIETSVDRAFAATRSKIKDAAATLQATTASSFDLAAKKAAINGIRIIALQEHKRIEEIVEYKFALIREQVIRNCVALLYEDDLIFPLMEIIESTLSFRKRDIDISSDLHQARAALQRYVLSLGILSPLEEFVARDQYSRHCFNLDANYSNAKDNGKNARMMSMLMRTLHEGNRKLAMQSLSARPALSRVLIANLEMPESRGVKKTDAKLDRYAEDNTEYVLSARYVLALLNCGDELTDEVR